MQELTLDRATSADLPVIMHIIADARALLKKQGIPQWQAEYPAATDIQKDIDAGTGRILRTGGKIAAYASLDDEVEPVYAALQGGSWEQKPPYSTIHRVAMSAVFQGQHLSVPFLRALIKEAGQSHDSVRVDTQVSNQVMQHIITKLGFVRRGTVKWDFEVPVVECYAYELVLKR